MPTMSADPNKKSARTFQCRDVLWETFEQMARELECSIDYLINESMKQYARQRSYSPGPGGQRQGFGGPQSPQPNYPNSYPPQAGGYGQPPMPNASMRPPQPPPPMPGPPPPPSNGKRQSLPPPPPMGGARGPSSARMPNASMQPPVPPVPPPQPGSR